MLYICNLLVTVYEQNTRFQLATLTIASVGLDRTWSLIALVADGIASVDHCAGSQLVLSGNFSDMEPQFKLLVYGKQHTTEGLPVLKQTGPHGRAVFWEPSVQLCGIPTPS